MHKWIAYLQDITQTNQQNNPPKREDFLKKSIQDAQRLLNDAYQGMQNVNEPALIDRYIYEWKAANLRYSFLLHEMQACQPDAIYEDVSDDSIPDTPELLEVSSDRISSTNRDTDTSLLNRSFK